MFVHHSHPLYQEHQKLFSGPKSSDKITLHVCSPTSHDLLPPLCITLLCVCRPLNAQASSFFGGHWGSRILQHRPPNKQHNGLNRKGCESKSWPWQHGVHTLPPLWALTCRIVPHDIIASQQLLLMEAGAMVSRNGLSNAQARGACLCAFTLCVYMHAGSFF